VYGVEEATAPLVGVKAMILHLRRVWPGWESNAALLCCWLWRSTAQKRGDLHHSIGGCIAELLVSLAEVGLEVDPGLVDFLPPVPFRDGRFETTSFVEYGVSFVDSLLLGHGFCSQVSEINKVCHSIKDHVNRILSVIGHVT
jgi:hypothetical protein